MYEPAQKVHCGKPVIVTHCTFFQNVFGKQENFAFYNLIKYKYIY